MNRLLTLIVLFLALFSGINAVHAAPSDIDAIIKKSPLDKTSVIAVSVKNARTGNVLYEYNQEKLLNPASALKVFTLAPALYTLGKDYQFKTQLYKDAKNNLYIKLAGDPTLTTNSLSSLLSQYQGSVQDIIIDPSAVDYLEWGVGWMWDDDASPYFPKFSQFSVNENKISVNIKPGTNNAQPEIKNRSNYQIVLVNKLKNGSKNNITVSRMPWQAGEITVFEGTVANETTIKIPVDYTDRHFVSCLEQALSKAGLKPTGSIKVSLLPENVQLVDEVASAPLNELVAITLKESNNLNTELIFKAAGGKFTGSQGSTLGGVKMFEDYYSNIKKSKPVIADASGTSRNDLVCVDWMTDALNKFYNQKNFAEFETMLAKPVEGTLSNRLLEISRFLRAKTGTLSGASSLTGYVTAKSGTKYAFAIIIQNYAVPTAEAKALEDKIVNAIYLH